MMHAHDRNILCFIILFAKSTLLQTVFTFYFPNDFFVLIVLQMTIFIINPHGAKMEWKKPEFFMNN